MPDPATILSWILAVPRSLWRGVSWPARAIHGHFRLHRELLEEHEGRVATRLDAIAGNFAVALMGNQAQPGLLATKQLEELLDEEGDYSLIRRIEDELGGYRTSEHLQEALPTFPRRVQPFGVYVYRRNLGSPIPDGTLEPSFRAYLVASVSTIETYLRESDGEYVWFEGRNLLPVDESDREQKRRSDMHQSTAMESMGTPRGSRPYPVPIGEIRQLTIEWFACIREANERLREQRRRNES